MPKMNQRVKIDKWCGFNENVLMVFCNPFVRNAPFLYPLKTLENGLRIKSRVKGKVHIGDLAVRETSIPTYLVVLL